MSTPPRRVLFTGGRAPATLVLARNFHAAGHTVYVAECLAQHLCSGSRAVTRCFQVPPPNPDAPGFIQGLSDIVREVGIDLLVPTCEEVFYVGEAAGRLPCTVFAPAWETLKRLHSKWAFIQDLAARGVAVPETWLVTSAAELEATLAAQPASRKVVIKPVFSRFGTDVKIQRAGDRPPAIQVSTSRPWVVQAFIEGRGLCTYGIAYQGKLRAHAAYGLEFTAGLAAIHFRHVKHAKLLKWVQDFVAFNRITGQVAFDFIEAPDGTLYPLECNPRATSGALLFGPGDRVDRCFFEAEGALVEPAAASASMLTLPMWLYGAPAALQGGLPGLAAWGQALAGAQDAIFRWDDPLPALSQVAVYGEFVRRAGLAGVTPLAATTHDIEWNGDA